MSLTLIVRNWELLTEWFVRIIIIPVADPARVDRQQTKEIFLYQ